MMKHNFQKNRLAILAIFICLIFSEAAISRHIIGGTMTYAIIPSINPGNKIVEITMLVTRDCNPASGGADFDSPANIAVYKSTGQSIEFVLNQTVSAINITSSIPTLPAWVTAPDWFCEEIGTYFQIFDLPTLDPGEYYIFEYQRCCKSINFFTLLTAENSGLTLSVEVSAAAMAAENATPTFNNIGSIVACVHDSLSFDYLATEMAGDSISYRLSPLIHGGGPSLDPAQVQSCEGVQPIPPCSPPFDTVPYINENFTFSSPLGTGASFHLDNLTGQITALPQVVGAYLIGVDVDQYRDGQKVATIHSEFALQVIDCLLDIPEKPDESTQVKITPNPAGEMLLLNIENQKLINSRYQLKNLNGLEVSAGQITGRTHEIHRNNLPAGVYFLEITTATGSRVVKRVVFQ